MTFPQHCILCKEIATVYGIFRPSIDDRHMFEQPQYMYFICTDCAKNFDENNMTMLETMIYDSEVGNGRIDC
jgi:hypothetical protein